MATIDDLSPREIRRDLHAHPEEGWTEFRTTALIAEALDERGFTCQLGADALAVESRLGVPEDVPAAVERARETGAPEPYLDRMDGVTGLVAEKRYGDGPVVAVRTDVDALPVTESTSDDHRPAREGFASRHPGTSHACGHDGHAAIGVGVARAIDDEGGFDGTLKLVFQPAEEGGRGGLPTSESGHLDDVDRLVAVHLGLGLETGTVIAGREHPLPNTKIDVTYRGEPAHAGHAPNEGRNALQAAATAIGNLYAIPRHGDGATRINVGEVHSPNGQNVVADRASLRVETRGATDELDAYVLDHARRIVAAAAEMHDVEVETERYGAAADFEPDAAMIDRVIAAAGTVDAVDEVIRRKRMGGSEDASYLIRRVQDRGGVATYVGIGASNPSGHHTAEFDVDEDAIDLGIDLVAATVRGRGD